MRKMLDQLLVVLSIIAIACSIATTFSLAMSEQEQRLQQDCCSDVGVLKSAVKEAVSNSLHGNGVDVQKGLVGALNYTGEQCAIESVQAKGGVAKVLQCR